MNFELIILIYVAIIGWILTVIGWVAAFWFGMRQQRNILKDNSNMRVYEELSEASFKIQKSLINLAYTLRFEITLLEMKREELQIKLQGGDVQQVFKIYSLKKEEMLEKYVDFMESHLEFVTKVNLWIGIISELNYEQKLLSQEVDKFKKEVEDYRNRFELKDDSDWDKFNVAEVKTISDNLADKNFMVLTYLSDFMTDVHNSLIGPLFGFEKKKSKRPRGTYKVLTKEGFVEAPKIKLE